MSGYSDCKLRQCNQAWTSISPSSAAGSRASGWPCRLRREGIEDFVVLERGDGVGGTWHSNTYPGCACDVPVAPVLVLVRAEPRLDADLLPPARDPRLPEAGRRRGRAARIRARPRGDRRAGRDGSRWQRRDRRRVPCARECWWRGTGRSCEPKIPDFPGLDDLRRRGRSTPRAGTTTCDLRGKRVASVGTGASAIQYVPADRPRRRPGCTVLQRTPPWVMPHSARPISGAWSGASSQRFPAVQRAAPRRHLLRAGAAGARDGQAPARHEAARAGWPPAHRERAARIRRCIAKATPDYTRRLQADPAVQRLVSGPRARERGARHRTAWPRCARTRWC